MLPLMLLMLAAESETPKPFNVQSLAFSPDGKTLAASGWIAGPPGATIAWDVESKKELWHRRAGAGFVTQSFAGDGKTLAITHNKPTVLRLDAATGKELGEIGPHPKVVRAAIRIPGTDLLATGSDSIIRLWNVKTGAVAKELKGHTENVYSLLASPDGKWLVSQARDTTRFWDVANGKELIVARVEKTRYSMHDTYASRFVAVNRVLLCYWGDQIICELPTGKEIMRFRNERAYNGNALSLAAGLAAHHEYEGTEVIITDLTFRDPTAEEKARIEKLLKEFDDDSYDVRETASTAMRKIGSVAEPGLRAAATNSPSAEVRSRARVVRQTILEEPLRRLKGHAGFVGPMVFSPNGELIATGAADGTLRLWDPQTGKELAMLEVTNPAEK
jgi:hypothetical protein